MVYLKQYLAAIWADWVSRMSGIAGLLLIVIAFAFRLTEVGQARYWVGAAAVCFVIASFSAWRTERLNVERLDGIIKGLEQVTENIALQPKDMVQVFEGRTSIAGQKLAAAYIGKWMTVTGKVRDVGEMMSQARVTLGCDNKISVYSYFPESLTDTVSFLKQGDSITVRGQVTRIEQSFLALEECELMRVLGSTQ